MSRKNEIQLKRTQQLTGIGEDRPWLGFRLSAGCLRSSCRPWLLDRKCPLRAGQLFLTFRPRRAFSKCRPVARLALRLQRTCLVNFFRL